MPCALREDDLKDDGSEASALLSPCHRDLLQRATGSTNKSFSAWRHHVSMRKTKLRVRASPLEAARADSSERPRGRHFSRWRARYGGTLWTG